jgi:uncharacterized protein (TIGR02001 family)
MARGRLLAGIVKSGIVGAALIAGFAAQAYAGDPPKLALSGSATFTTDYMFRSISNTSQNPAVQPEFDLTYGMFFAGIWGSNTAFGEGIEIDYYAGIAPTFWGINWNVTALEYTYPGNDGINYFELKTGAAKTWGNVTLSINNYWSPDNFGLGTQSDAVEGGAAYAFTNKLFGFFSPSISGTLGVQTYESLVPDYVYWNAGVTLGFLDHWSADIRYYDTNYSKNDCALQSGGRDNCDARVVGAIKATF